MNADFSSRWFRAAVIGLMVVGIVIVLTVGAFDYAARHSYPRASDNLQTIYIAEEQCKLTYPKRGYSRSLAELGTGKEYTCPQQVPNESAACLIDSVLTHAANPETPKGGFVYTYIAGQPNVHGIVDSYSVYSDPLSPQSGTHHFYIDETGVERIERDIRAGKNSPVRKPD